MDDDNISRTTNPKDILQNLPKPSTIRLKIISMGDEGTGKSCIIKRYCEERFIAKYISTIGIDYGVKRVQISAGGGGGGEASVEARVNFWDLAGGEEYTEIRNEFYKDAQGAILVYDVTNPSSFAKLDSWLKEAYNCGMPKDVVICICANKTDLPKRAVSESDGRKWAAAKGFAYWETSANTGQNVSKMFQQLFEDTFVMKAR